MSRSWIVVVAACGLLSCADEPAPSTSETTDAVDSGTVATNGSGTDSSSDSSGADDTSGTQGCEMGSAAGLAQCVEEEPIAQDVAFLADIRDPGSAHWLAVQELCADRLTMLGFDVELHDYGTGINVIGRRAGTTASDEVVLLGAHYDHIPGCLGADDNATGVAGILEAARVLSTVDTERTLAVACWDEEELGLIGSTEWVEGGQLAAQTVVTYFNFDMIGYATDEPNSQSVPVGFDAIFPDQYARVEADEFRGNFILIIADDLALAPTEAYEAHAELVDLVAISGVLDAASKNSDLFADLRRSDHAPFWGVDIPALFLSDTADFRNAAYHCMGGEDSVDTLDFDFSRRVIAAAVGSAAQTLGLP